MFYCLKFEEVQFVYPEDDNINFICNFRSIQAGKGIISGSKARPFLLC